MRVRRTAKVDVEAIVDITDRCSLRIAVLAHGRDRHVVRVIEDQEISFFSPGSIAEASIESQA